jgi:predicted RNA-binding Zn ribbon-like protein
MNQSDQQATESFVYPGGTELIAGRVCLDFTNTVGSRHGTQVREYLTGYQELVAWAQLAGILSEGGAWRLAALAAQRPQAAEEALARALALREAIHRIFSAPYAGQKAAASDLDLLNRELAGGMQGARIGWEQGRYRWRWPAPDTTLDAMLGLLARSAAELLTDEHMLARVRRCANSSCGWLFLDTSKNHSRRWCSMSDCGNRAKARRHYSRRRAAEG